MKREPIDDLHRVKFIHEGVHDRLLNWARWCISGQRGASSSPMFRHYKAPRYRNSVDDDIRIPIDTLQASETEKIVGSLPEKHRDAIRWFYVTSRIGIGIWQAQRELAVQRDTLVKLIHDGRSMVKNRSQSSGRTLCTA